MSSMSSSPTLVAALTLAALVTTGLAASRDVTMAWALDRDEAR